MLDVHLLLENKTNSNVFPLPRHIIISKLSLYSYSPAMINTLFDGLQVLLVLKKEFQVLVLRIVMKQRWRSLKIIDLIICSSWKKYSQEDIIFGLFHAPGMRWNSSLSFMIHLSKRFLIRAEGQCKKQFIALFSRTIKSLISILTHGLRMLLVPIDAGSIIHLNLEENIHDKGKYNQSFLLHFLSFFYFFWLASLF